MNEQRQMRGASGWSVMTLLVLFIVGFLLAWLIWQVSAMQKTLQGIEGNIEVVGIALENQRERMDSIADEVRDQRISTRTAIKNLTVEIERQKEPSELIFKLDTGEADARRMWNNCMAERLTTAIGPLGAMLTQTEDFEEVMNFDEIIGFSGGDLSSEMEIGFMGSFFGCWTFGTQTPVH